jgi:hypothetical protein
VNDFKPHLDSIAEGATVHVVVGCRGPGGGWDGAAAGVDDCAVMFSTGVAITAGDDLPMSALVDRTSLRHEDTYGSDRCSLRVAPSRGSPLTEYVLLVVVVIFLVSQSPPPSHPTSTSTSKMTCLNFCFLIS